MYFVDERKYGFEHDTNKSLTKKINKKYFFPIFINYRNQIQNVFQFLIDIFNLHKKSHSVLFMSTKKSNMSSGQQRIPIEERLLAEFRSIDTQNARESTNKKRKKSNKPCNLTIEPPKKCTRKLPDVSIPRSQEQNVENQNVLRYILDNLDQGKDFTDFLPLTKGEEIHNSSIRPEEFQEIDEETFQRLNALYDAEIQKKNQEKLLEEELNETAEYRSESPGKKYEKDFINAEIGVRKPRFRAKALQELFKNDPSMKKSDMKRLLASGKLTERELNEEYKKHASPKMVVKRMLAESKKKKLEEHPRFNK